MNISRTCMHRWFSALLLLMPITLMSTASSAADASAQTRVVYHIDDSARAMSAMRSMTNHLRAAPKTRIVVVALSDGVDFLLSGAKDPRGNPYEPMIDDLVTTGVEFRACNNTLVGRQIEKSRLHPDTSIVESGVAEITRLQASEGFAYLKP